MHKNPKIVDYAKKIYLHVLAIPSDVRTLEQPHFDHPPWLTATSVATDDVDLVAPMLVG